MHDLATEHGRKTIVCSNNEDAWKWSNVKRKTGKDDALKLTRMAASNELNAAMQSPWACGVLRRHKCLELCKHIGDDTTHPRWPMSDHALRVDTSNSRIIKQHLNYASKSLDGYP